ncbi:hypothetical protein [Sphingopyxis witflariensis]|uniref:Lipoprotein n=1 Tax=Sphingopyxis witflariensis TaxID=173675 RepID=A0A246JQZ7_9SPHN|nr:hypothetical protein [Sphingopyxis witflariensis]OWQ95276.1 hypothetical protein CDQ91_13340 [Sphingopyxis witflariensis]
MTTRVKFPVFAAMAVALLVAGCGSKSEKEVASGTYTDPETGKTADYKISGDGENGKVTIKTEEGEVQFGGVAKLPAGITPYPGSKMTGGFAGSGKDGKGGLASFEVKGKAADVVAHYRKQIDGAGMKVTSEIAAEDTIIIGAEKPGDAKTTIQINATQNGDMVEGAITYSGA